MHTYSIKSSANIRKQIGQTLFFISVVLCPIINMLISLLPESIVSPINDYFSQWSDLGIGLVIGGITALTLYRLLSWLFDKYLWKLGLVKKYTKMVDFSGKWEGSLRSSFSPELEMKVVATIKQTWSEISVHCVFTNLITNERTTSSSESAHIVPEYDNMMSLLSFTYRNKSINHKLVVREHRGTNDLYLSGYDENKKKHMELRGDYYNNRGTTPNLGSIDLLRKC